MEPPARLGRTCPVGVLAITGPIPENLLSPFADGDSKFRDSVRPYTQTTPEKASTYAASTAANSSSIAVRPSAMLSELSRSSIAESRLSYASSIGCDLISARSFDELTRSSGAAPYASLAALTSSIELAELRLSKAASAA